MRVEVKWLLVLTLLLATTGVQAQGNLFKTLKAVRTLRAAQKDINDNQFEDARKKLNKAIEVKPDFAVAYRELGKVELELENYTAAAEAYQASFDLDPRISRAAYYECGEALFRLEQFDKAQYYFDQYKALEGTSYVNKRREVALEAQHDLSAVERAKNFAFALAARENPLCDPPLNLGPLINSPKDDYMPSLSNDGNILYYTTHQTYSLIEEPTGENIYVAERKDNVWLPPSSIGININTKANEGMAKVAADERYMYFTGCSRPSSLGGCDIYRALLNKMKVVSIEPLSGFINSEFWDSQPSITCDGRTMYFCSSRDDGIGGSDIYMSYLQDDGTWSDAENLGPKINTAGDEEAPFISPDGQTFFFTSTGHLGMGDGDIFVSRRYWNGQAYDWTEPENLGYPINSTFRDVGLYLKADGYTAVFSSARLGGQGGLDLYEVKLPEQFQPDKMAYMQGRVTDDLTGEPLQAKVVIVRKDGRRELLTDEDGRYFVCLPANKAYSIMVNKNNYKAFREFEFLEETTNEVAFSFNIALESSGLPPVAPSDEAKEQHYNIYFEVDDYSLSANAQSQLNNVVHILENEAGWTVEIIGYTDSQGGSSYNNILSGMRAEAVKAYFVNKGIRNINMRTEGRGAIMDGSAANNPNDRRVEIIIRK